MMRELYRDTEFFHCWAASTSNWIPPSPSTPQTSRHRLDRHADHSASLQQEQIIREQMPFHETKLLLLHSSNGIFSMTTLVSRYQKGKTSLELNETRDDEVLECSGISWTICKQSAPWSRQITTSTCRHSIFTSRMPFPTPNQQSQSTEGFHYSETEVSKKQTVIV